MKLHRITILTTVAASSCIALAAAQAQNQDASHYNNPPAKVDAPRADNLQPAEPQRAGDLIGMEVTDSQDHKAGTVRDLFIDLRGGNIVEVIVGPGGLGRSEDKLQALPPSCFTYAPSGKDLRLNNITADDLKNAPSFSMTRWKEDAANSAKVTECYQRFHAVAPGFGDRDLQRASLVIGASVKNDQDQKLGRVENLIVFLPQARIDKVIMASGGFLGVDRELTAFAPQSFTYSPESDRLTLNMTPDAVKAAPHFKAGDWKSAVTAGSTASLAPADQRAGRTEAYYSGQSAPLEVIKPVISEQSDSSITAAIEQKVQTDESLSFNAQHAAVETHEGKVTLRGTVNTQYDHLRLSEIAASVAGINNVDNETVVAGNPVAGNAQQ